MSHKYVYPTSMSRKEQKEYNQAQIRTIAHQQFKKQKYAHDFMCDCRRCEPGIITKWNRIKKEMA